MVLERGAKSLRLRKLKQIEGVLGKGCGTLRILLEDAVVEALRALLVGYRILQVQTSIKYCS